MVKSKNK